MEPASGYPTRATLVSPRHSTAGGSWRSRGFREPGSMVAMPLALTLDALLGEPPARAHPVVWIGSAVSAFEERAPTGPTARFFYGTVMTTLVVSGAALVGAGASRIAARLPFG